jgi:hypothetical protein
VGYINVLDGRFNFWWFQYNAWFVQFGSNLIVPFALDGGSQGRLRALLLEI